jgi:hypothetical protein
VTAVLFVAQSDITELAQSRQPTMTSFCNSRFDTKVTAQE